MNEYSSVSKIFLTGFSGSGKSTLAPLLASRFGYHSRDIDTELEHYEGASCNEVIQRCGLAYFRIREKGLIYDIIEKEERCVVALGGGAVTIDGIIPHLRKNVLVVWIQVKLEEIINRLRSKNDRPLLQGKTEEELSLFLCQRESYYRQVAHLAVDVSGLSVEKTVDKLHDSIVTFLGQK